jgi:3-dehydro-L-gulonate 2-dehydrogenase
MAALCFTNTMPNMPAWGALDARLGNNPLVLALPRAGGHVVLDMATSQFSYGALELARLNGRQMPIEAGFDTQGQLTRDPAEIIQSKRILPMGYWKGAGLSLLLDLFAGMLSLGNTTLGIGRLAGDEHGLSQVFIAIHYAALADAAQADAIMTDTLSWVAASAPDGTGTAIRWPGSRMPAVREANLREGIPVDERVWAEILGFHRAG